MRFLSIICLCLCLYACADPAATDPAEPDAAISVPKQEVIPFDRRMGDDPSINAIKTAYARIEDAFESNGLTPKKFNFNCNDLLGRIEVFRENDEVVLAIGYYKDGTQRTVSDRWYFRNGQLIFQLSENNTWQLDGPMIKDGNGNEVPGVKNTTYQYRYYVSDDKVIKALKKKWDHFSYRTDNAAPESIPYETMPATDRLPFQYTLIESVIAADSVNCDFFSKVE